MLVALILAATQTCFPAPPEIKKMGAEAVQAYADALAKSIDDALEDEMTPEFASAPKGARPLMALLWSRREEPRALKPLMSFTGDVPSASRLKAALEGICSLSKGELTCAGKGARISMRQKDGCWEWIGFT